MRFSVFSAGLNDDIIRSQSRQNNYLLIIKQQYSCSAIFSTKTFFEKSREVFEVEALKTTKDSQDRWNIGFHMFCNELRSLSQPVYKLGKSTQRTVSVLLMLLGLEAPACYSCRCVTDVVRFVLSVCITVRAFMVSYREHTASWHLIGHDR